MVDLLSQQDAPFVQLHVSSCQKAVLTPRLASLHVTPLAACSQQQVQVQPSPPPPRYSADSAAIDFLNKD